jgi:hypothetical protein
MAKRGKTIHYISRNPTIGKIEMICAVGLGIFGLLLFQACPKTCTGICIIAAVLWLWGKIRHWYFNAR